MKKSYRLKLVLLVFFAFALIKFGYAQNTGTDKIYKKDNTVLSVKIIEVTESAIKYKKSNYLDGPTYLLSKFDIATIQYANGDSEVISTPPPSAPTTNNSSSNGQQSSSSASAAASSSSRPRTQTENNQSSRGTLLGALLDGAVEALTGNYSESGTSIRFKNVSGYTIEHFYLSPASKSNWGQDWLGEYVLRNNETVTVKVACGLYDVKTVDIDGLECIKYNFRVCSSTFWELDECD